MPTTLLELGCIPVELILWPKHIISPVANIHFSRFKDSPARSKAGWVSGLNDDGKQCTLTVAFLIFQDLLLNDLRMCRVV